MQRKIYAAASVLLAFSFTSPGRTESQTTFHRQAIQIGWQTQQEVRLDANMKSRVKSPGDETIEARQIDYTLQRRTVTVLSAQPTFVTKARVSFEKALQKLGQVEKDQLDWIEQPVHGKSYEVSRTKDGLVVTADDGSVPSEAERRIVEHSMRSVGRPNPIATFLHGRTVAIGESIVMPAELANQLLGSRHSVEGTEEMPIKLVRIETIDRRNCGIFAARYRRVTQDRARTSSTLAGEIAVQADTCQVVSIQFNGPVTFRQFRSFGGQQKTIESVGTIAIAMKSSPAVR